MDDSLTIAHTAPPTLQSRLIHQYYWKHFLALERGELVEADHVAAVLEFLASAETGREEGGASFDTLTAILGKIVAIKNAMEQHMVPFDQMERVGRFVNPPPNHMRIQRLGRRALLAILHPELLEVAERRRDLFANFRGIAFNRIKTPPASGLGALVWLSSRGVSRYGDLRTKL